MTRSNTRSRSELEINPQFRKRSPEKKKGTQSKLVQKRESQSR